MEDEQPGRTSRAARSCWTSPVPQNDARTRARARRKPSAQLSGQIERLRYHATAWHCTIALPVLCANALLSGLCSAAAER